MKKHLIETVIFDLDGLLADTEKLHRRTYQDTLAEFGIKLSDKQYEDHWIRRGRGIAEFAAENNLLIDTDLIRSIKAHRYNDLVRSSVEPRLGAISLLSRLKNSKILGLATSSYLNSVEVVLSTLGIADCFSCIATKESTIRVKPFPDIFLYTARELNTHPSHCLVLEDAEKGILAAEAAGMKSIAVPNIYTVHNNFSKATIVLQSLEDVTLELIDEL